MSDPRDDANPYRSPEADTGPVTATAPTTFDLADLTKFRDQINALGAIWVLLGGIVMVAALEWSLQTAPPDLGHQILLKAAEWLGAYWLLSGIFTLRKNLRAARGGLVLSYLAALSLGPCSALVMLPVIIQAHRVLRWAKEFQARGIPLNARIK